MYRPEFAVLRLVILNLKKLLLHLITANYLPLYDTERYKLFLSFRDLPDIFYFKLFSKTSQHAMLIRF